MKPRAAPTSSTSGGPLNYARTRSQVEIDAMDEQLTELEHRLLQMNTSQESLNKRFLELTELRHVLRETAVFFDRGGAAAKLVADDGNGGGGGYRDDDGAGLLSNAVPHARVAAGVSGAAGGSGSNDDITSTLDRAEGGMRGASLG